VNESTARLVAVLREQKPSPKMARLIERAERDEFHDFLSPLVFPQLALAEALKDDHRHALATRVLRGEFDATTAEAQAWADSPDGQATFAELATPEGLARMKHAVDGLEQEITREVFHREEP